MEDILLTYDGDVDFTSGDLLPAGTDRATAQHKRDILISAPGDVKEFPTVGVGAVEYIQKIFPDCFGGQPAFYFAALNGIFYDLGEKAEIIQHVFSYLRIAAYALIEQYIVVFYRRRTRFSVVRQFHRYAPDCRHCVFYVL